jgi:hypothetical protein
LGSDLTPAEADSLTGGHKFTQSSHGFSVGDVIRRSSATAYTKAQADSDANIGVGLSLVVDVTDTSNFTAIAKGKSHAVTITSHGFGSFGTQLYLSQGTSGLITATAPTGGRKLYLGFVIDTNTIFWEPGLTWENLG